MKPLVDHINIILFDLDGTILDNYEWTYSSLKATLLAFGYPLLTQETYNSIQGMGEPYGLRKLGISPEKMEEVVCYRRRIMRETAGKVTLFDGIQDLSLLIKQAGFQTGIVTGSSRDWVEMVPAARQAVAYFGLLVTMEDTTHPKPDPAPILCALERLGGKPDQAVYIGDTPRDIESANRAGCVSVLASWNGSRYENDLNVQPDYVVSTITAFKQLLLG